MIMGLRCSVLGHRYGERERIEERDDQGSEVVVATREVKTCERCGEELMISESKEITSTQEPEPESPSEPAPDPPSDAPDPQPEPNVESEPDDGIILSDTPADREPGEWPADPDHNEDDEIEETDWTEMTEDGTESDEDDSPAEEWPDSVGDDEGFDAIAGDVDDELADEIIDVVSQETGRSTEAEDTEDGFARAGPIESPADPQNTDVHTEYFCPRCSWSARSLTTSVRRGDICPSCRTGYVAEREPRNA